MGTGQLLIAVCLKAGPKSEQFLRDLESICNDPETLIPGSYESVRVENYAKLEQLAAALDNHFQDPAGKYAVVVSDKLARSGQFANRAKELIDPHFHNPLVTLAVTSTAKHVPDIDRVVAPSADRDDLADALGLLSQRLQYIGPPCKHQFEHPFRVRPIPDEFELWRYYRLRQRVYRIMGYVSEEKERVRAQLEIDGCDVNAIHLGAFELCEGHHNLVGTARILLSNGRETRWAEWTRHLLKFEKRLRAIVEKENLPLGLPVFQSQQLNSHLQESMEKELLCAELSRVIVTSNYRGAGLSRMLVQNAIDVAAQNGVDRLYLECLRLHEPMYAKYGFESISGTGAEVIGVGRSMAAMMLSLTPAGVPAATA